MRVYIPTRGRAGQVSTLAALPASILAVTQLVVSRAERAEYEAAYPGVSTMTVAVEGIGPVRQAIIRDGAKRGDGKVCMLDDDLKFFVRRKDDPTKFLDATERDVAALFVSISDFLDVYVHAGVLAREGGHTVTDKDVVYNTRMLRMLAYDAKELVALKIRYDRLPVMEDFDTTLQLLRAGRPNAVLCQWVHGQRGSGAKGGCSEYRDATVQANGATGLAALHPGFVRVVDKTTKTAWGGGTRKDVVVSWKKAYESSQI